MAQLVEQWIPNPKVGGSSPSRPASNTKAKYFKHRPVAQLVEQWIPNPKVGGSSPSRPAIPNP